MLPTQRRDMHTCIPHIRGLKTPFDSHLETQICVLKTPFNCQSVSLNMVTCLCSMPVLWNLHILLSQTQTPSTHTHKCTQCVCLIVFLSHTVEVCFPHTEEICKHVSPTSVYLRPRSIPTWGPKSAYLRPRSIANLCLNMVTGLCSMPVL